MVALGRDLADMFPSRQTRRSSYSVRSPRCREKQLGNSSEGVCYYLITRGIELIRCIHVRTSKYVYTYQVWCIHEVKYGTLGMHSNLELLVLILSIIPGSESYTYLLPGTYYCCSAVLLILLLILLLYSAKLVLAVLVRTWYTTMQAGRSRGFPVRSHHA